MVTKKTIATKKAALSKVVTTKPVKFKGPDRTWSMNYVEIKLTPEQQAELSKLAGEPVASINLAIEELADLADLIAN